MILRRLTIMTALAVATAFGLAGTARADYRYTATVLSVNGTGSPTATVAGVTVAFSGTTDLLNATVVSSPTYGLINVTTANTTPSGTVTIPYLYQLAIQNPSPGGVTQNFFVSGNLTFSGVTAANNGGGNFDNVFAGVSTTIGGPFTQTSPTVNVGGTNFTLFEPTTQNAFFTPPTVNPPAGQPLGGLAIRITPSAPAGVPEPASVVMLGLGLAGIGLVSLRNRRARA
jgi:hypothetical protein